jgi:hypothetical protein
MAFGSKGYKCCLCGSDIPADDPCLVHILLSGVTGDPEASQEVFAHARCVKRAFHPSVPLLFSEECEDLLAEEAPPRPNQPPQQTGGA